ncbi:MAG: amidohydrolase/deacetylase family metallohydrolase [Acidobacteriales bacterium]|nr:amidohydrolase/deacetylase family metallohydrolase [Terriglobales bacterium]
MRWILLLAGVWCALAQTPYDLVLKGGHVIDPKNKISAVRDVAIAKGRIAAVEADIPAAKAKRVIDVRSLYVTPGLVDIHVHAFAGSCAVGEHTGELGVYPDDFTLRSGVTTVADAGSSGWRGMPEFYEKVAKRSRTRVYAFVNIVGRGMSGKPEQDPTEMDPAAAAECARRFKDFVVGIKTAHYAGPEWVAVDRAIQAAELAGLPVMVDFGEFVPQRPFAELITKKLRPGDMYTHLYLERVPMFDSNGRVAPYLWEARKRGVLFDLGHGAGSFIFRYAVPAMRQGFRPDSISTDLHTGSMNAGMKDMLNVMSKMLNMEMPLDEVILRSTWQPAKQIRREVVGHLSVGAAADVAVLRLAHGDFGFVDVYGARMKGTSKLVAELTLREGKVAWDLNGLASQDWQKLDNYGPPK